MLEGHDAIFEIRLNDRLIYNNNSECGNLPQVDEIVDKIAGELSTPQADENCCRSDMIQSSESNCCAPQPIRLEGLSTETGIDLAKMNEPWITENLKTPAGDVPTVSTNLDFSDRLGACKVRWGIGRMSFIVPSGLYAVGRPDAASPVFVSANYKMSFDRLRAELGGIDGWILVLDTKGINVWCAAGKGTFGTDELVARIRATGLEQVVSHRKLILPQLGAPGVSAHKVKERSGFKVIYGPVLAREIPAFLENGMKTTPAMRLVKFPLRQRLALIPVELIMSFKYALISAVALLILSGFGSDIYSLERALTYGPVSALLIMATHIAGTALPSALLPWLPGRSFAVKGAVFGLLLAALVWWHGQTHPELYRGWIALAAWLAIIPAVTSFQTMNFTGSSTYTSLSGVLKEMRRAMPVQIGAVVIGLGFWITGLFV